METNYPDISGRNYGVYRQSSEPMYFYDGIIKGSTKAVYGIITDIEENTDYSADITTATEVYLLEQGANQAKIGETEYATLQEAIDNATVGDTIQLLKGVGLFADSEPIVISEDQEIIIDMAGCNMLSALETLTIQNSGTLSLQNTSDTSSEIKAVSSNVIVNNIGARLYLNNITIVFPIQNSWYNTEIIGNSLQNAGAVQIQNTTISQPVVNTGTMDIIESDISNTIKTDGTINMYSGNINNIIINDVGNVVQNEGWISRIESNGGNVHLLGGSVDYISSSGDVRVVAGTAGKIYSSGRVTLGTKDGIVTTESPVITGGIDSYEEGKLYFYDGTVTGSVKAISGNITDLETNTELFISGSQTVTLQTVDGPAASIDGTNYMTLQDAIDAGVNGSKTTIIILRDTVTTEAHIPSGKDIVLDINGKNLLQYSNALVNDGTLQIVDNSGLTTGKINGDGKNGIHNTGTLEVKGVNIANNVIAINNLGTCYVREGAIYENDIGIKNVGSGTLIVEDTVFNSNSKGIEQESYGTVTVNGAIFRNGTYGIYQSESGTTTITSGTFDTNESATYATYGTIVVENANFTGNTYANHVAGGRITILNGTFTNNQHGMYIQAGQGFSGIKDTVVGVTPNIVGTVSGIKVDAGGVLHFYDGTIQGTESAISGYATYVEDGYKVQSSTVDGLYTDTLALAGTVQTVAKVDDVEFSSVQAAINSCIGDTAKTVTLLNTVTVNESLKIDSDLKVILDLNKHNIEGNFAGSIIDNSGELTIIDTSTEKTGKIINNGGQGIYNTGTLTIGTDDGTVEETVRVEGSTTGLQTTGTFNYYDGLLAGTTVIEGTVNSLPNGSVIRTRTENGLTVYYID